MWSPVRIYLIHYSIAEFLNLWYADQWWYTGQCRVVRELIKKIKKIILT